MTNPTPTAQVRVAALYCYPVKGLGAVALPHSVVGGEGLAWDRRWMVVDSAGRFVTQRQLPAMAAIQVSLERYQLCLRAPDGRRCYVPLTPPQGERVATQVHGNPCYGIDEGNAVAAWLDSVFREHWRHGLRLLRFAHDAVNDAALLRRVGEQRFARMGYPDRQASTGFADGYPLLIASRASLTAVNQALVANRESCVEMSRFRPNLVLEGLPAFIEHDIDTLGFNHDALSLWLCKPCERCPVTRVDQTSGEVVHASEPLGVLKQLGRFPGTAIFGVNAIVLAGQGQRVSVGDSATITWQT
ncbi:MOSC domain-containing protein [Carnimonas bestiolae]|uniref:MOSC domain-containing protein n=1 Tax=Carnimonas bestiolae TaxID=3402172 RepID=UPI003EDB789C